MRNKMMRQEENVEKQVKSLPELTPTTPVVYNTAASKARLRSKQKLFLRSVSEIPSPKTKSGQATTESTFGGPLPEFRPVGLSETVSYNPLSDAIKRGPLEQFVGPKYRRGWTDVYVIILSRKGLLGIYDHQEDPTPSSIIELRGKFIGMQGKKKKKHVFKLKDSNQRTVATFGTSNPRELTEWVTATANAVKIANENHSNT